jgi:RNA polymerase sigma-70 factor (ECF subfamily)
MDIASRAIAMSAGDERSSAANDKVRLRAMFAAYHDFIWRSLRRLGVPESGVDDAVQEVFVIASRKVSAIEPKSERGFLFTTALHIASNHRRARVRRREAFGENIELAHDPIPSPDELMGQKQARELFDSVLAELPIELRAVFVLYECEGLTLAEMTEVLELPQGTVASRLRRARDVFEKAVERVAAEAELERGTV